MTFHVEDVDRKVERDVASMDAQIILMFCEIHVQQGPNLKKIVVIPTHLLARGW